MKVMNKAVETKQVGNWLCTIGCMAFCMPLPGGLAVGTIIGVAG